MIRRFIPPPALLAVLLAALATGCGGPAATANGPPSSSSQAPARTSPEGASPRATRSPPAAASASASGLPIGFPAFPGAEQVAPDRADAIAAWVVDEDPPEVYAFYLDALPDLGFTIDGAFPGGEAAVIRFTAADGSTYQLDLTGRDPSRLTLGAPHD